MEKKQRNHFDLKDINEDSCASKRFPTSIISEGEQSNFTCSCKIQRIEYSQFLYKKDNCCVTKRATKEYYSS